MLHKTTLALTAAAVLGSGSAAFAAEDPANRIGDRYPFLEHVSMTATTAAAHKMVIARKAATRNVVEIEDPENKIADRYPWLEPGAKPIVFALTGGRLNRAASAKVQLSYEDPANRIGDRYPWLEPGAKPTVFTVTGGRTARTSTANVQLSYEDPANRIGDRYPFLEPRAPHQAKAMAVIGTSRKHARKQNGKGRV